MARWWSCWLLLWLVRTVSAPGYALAPADLTYTRGLDLSGTRQGAGGIGGLLARTLVGEF